MDKASLKALKKIGEKSFKLLDELMLLVDSLNTLIAEEEKKAKNEGRKKGAS